MPKPRYRFCWWCSHKLVGDHHATRIVEGREVIVHVACAKAVDGRDENLTARPREEED